MSKKAKKERKFTTLTAKYQGRTFHKSVSYYSARELAEKQQAFEASLQRDFLKNFATLPKDGRKITAKMLKPTLRAVTKLRSRI